MKELSIAILLAILLSATGCALLNPFATKVTDDLGAFLNVAQKYGSPQDQQCAQLLADAWGKIDALTSDDSGGVVAFAYRTILTNRLTQNLKQQAMQDCGGLAAEILVRIGKTAMKFRP